MNLKQLSKATLEELIQKISGLKLHELTEVTQLLDKTEKIHAIIEVLSDHNQLEAVGKGLNLEQLLDILNYLSHPERDNQRKLKAILLGTNRSTFKKLILNTNKELWTPLLQEELVESTAHQLRLCFHEIKKQINDHYETLEKIKNSIQFLDSSCSTKERYSFITQFKKLQEAAATTLDEIKNTLAFTWKINCAELIEELATCKESIERLIKRHIGSDNAQYFERTGLYLRLSIQLYNCYGEDDIEGADDNEPVIEGLIKLSLGYLDELWKLGLLPEIKEEKELELELGSHTEKEAKERRNQLFKQATERLEETGLRQVIDLKNNWIYSKETLSNWLKSHIKT